MKISEIEKKIEKFSFPMLPQMLVQIRQVTADETSNAKDLADIILKDQALTSKILSVANSAYYGFYGRVSTITQAIVALGFDSVKNIALGLATYNGLSALAGGANIQRFWEHSLATGVCAELLAEKLGYTPTEEALVGGLVHDVGKLMLVQICPEEYAEVERVLEEQDDAYSHIVEASLLGVTHSDVGRLLSRKWGFPKQLEEVIADHHKKEWGKSLLTDIVAFSDFMIQVLPSSRDAEKIERMINLGSSVLSLKKESISDVMNVLADRLEEYCRIFEIKIDNLMTYTTLVEEEYARAKADRQEQQSTTDEEVSILTEISNAMVAGRPQDEMLQMVLEGILRIERADAAVLFMVDYERSSLRGRLGLGTNAMYLASTYYLALDDQESVMVRAVVSGEKLFLHRPADPSAAATPDQELLTELSAATVCAYPLMTQQRAAGVLLIAWQQAKTDLQEADLQGLTLFANQALLVLGTGSDAGVQAAGKKRKRSSLLLDLD